MTAMEGASKNAGEMIEQLQLTYNRTRQAVITRELIEIISGASALQREELKQPTYPVPFLRRSLEFGECEMRFVNFFFIHPKDEMFSQM